MEWNWLDISTYLMPSVGILGGGIFFLAIISLLCGLVGNDITDGEGVRVGATVFFLMFIVILLPLALMPTHGRILKLKIAKIKNETVTQENLEKGVQTLERIAKKLECKYLGECRSTGHDAKKRQQSAE